MYALFNCGLYWIPEVELEYFRRYPKGLNPVQVNDIFFALHAVLATAITIGQCFIYEIGTQRVSITARFIHGIFSSFILISALLSIIQTIAWLDFLYFCSYVKLAITLIKYVPQAYYNYQRKSTVGWSIGNIFLDFTGGILSMLQMILNAYNYDDWESIFGDPTKFGLGFFSVAFDIFFLVQHYVLYRQLNCWTAGITKKHRKVYERTYPVHLVHPNGSTINIQYHEPRKIIKLPLDLNKLSNAEREALLEKRKPRTKIIITEDIDDDYDESRYINYNRR
ncbi:hypothetical protein PV325_006597 [Microctonus aethiopoides]|nr:hypothetical protein PV325_006597 [Microctonus aethiopoides]